MLKGVTALTYMLRIILLLSFIIHRNVSYRYNSKLPNTKKNFFFFLKFLFYMTKKVTKTD